MYDTFTIKLVVSLCVRGMTPAPLQLAMRTVHDTGLPREGRISGSSQPFWSADETEIRAGESSGRAGREGHPASNPPAVFRRREIRIVLEGVRGEESIAELCRREGIAASMYYIGTVKLSRWVGLAGVGGLGYGIGMSGSRDPIYAGHRYPAEVISHAVWLYFRYPLSLRMVEEMLAARGIVVSHETVRQWGLKFGREIGRASCRERVYGLV